MVPLHQQPVVKIQWQYRWSDFCNQPMPLSIGHRHIHHCSHQHLLTLSQLYQQATKIRQLINSQIFPNCLLWHFGHLFKISQFYHTLTIITIIVVVIIIIITYAYKQHTSTIYNKIKQTYPTNYKLQKDRQISTLSQSTFHNVLTIFPDMCDVSVIYLRQLNATLCSLKLVIV